MSQIRMLKLVHEVINKSQYDPTYIFGNKDSITVELHGDQDCIFFQNKFVSTIRDEEIDDEKPKLKQILDDYMGFDSDELFLCGDLIQIFGGAIRDAIGGNKINDIDVLCTSDSRIKLKKLLNNNGYKLINELHKESLRIIYKDIQIISEPKTYINKEMSIIQLIFPVVNITQSYEQAFQHLISNVDISCCGMSYNGIEVFEHVDGALRDAKEKTFTLCISHLMYSSKRAASRIEKLTKRGFLEISDPAIARQHRIDSIISDTIDPRIILNIKTQSIVYDASQTSLKGPSYYYKNSPSISFK
jgi:hypothetical protein